MTPWMISISCSVKICSLLFQPVRQCVRTAYFNSASEKLFCIFRLYFCHDQQRPGQKPQLPQPPVAAQKPFLRPAPADDRSPRSPGQEPPEAYPQNAQHPDGCQGPHNNISRQEITPGIFYAPGDGFAPCPFILLYFFGNEKPFLFGKDKLYSGKYNVYSFLDNNPAITGVYP